MQITERPHTASFNWPMRTCLIALPASLRCRAPLRLPLDGMHQQSVKVTPGAVDLKLTLPASLAPPLRLAHQAGLDGRE